jgi:nitrate reductase beta subunit
MFGPGVDHAIKTYRAAASDPDLAGLLGLFGCTEKILPRWRRQGDTVIGLDDSRQEVVRVPMREPVHVLQAFDGTYGVVRTNCP